MMQKNLIKRLFSSLRPTEPQAPKFNQAEFEPFKFQREREQLMYGYTMEELYGAKYGFRHSVAVKKEIYKDNVVLTISIFAALFYCLWKRDQRQEIDNSWDNYLNHDRNTKQDNLQ